MLQFLISTARVGTATTLKVFKLLVPTLIIVEILRCFGGLEMLEAAIQPLMLTLGLPPAFGLVWATALLTNLYSTVAVLALVLPGSGASVADVSVICTMALVAHALPVESAVSALLGLRWWFSITLRVGSALILGLLLSWLYHSLGYLQEPASLFLFELPQASGLDDWLRLQLGQLALIGALIYALIFINEGLRALGAERWLRLSLAPLLRGLGIGKEAAGVALVGCVLGITYGSALMVNEARLGRIKSKDLVLTALFLNLVHALIEDTLLMLLAGAHLSGILWARLLFGWLLTLVFLGVYPILERRRLLTCFFRIPAHE